MFFYNLGIRRVFCHVLCQGCRIVDSGTQRRGIGILRRLYDSDNGQLFPVFYEFFHICIVTGFVCPDIVLTVILVTVHAVYQAEHGPHNVVICVSSHILRYSNIFFIDELIHHLVKLQRVS